MKRDIKAEIYPTHHVMKSIVKRLHVVVQSPVHIAEVLGLSMPTTDADDGERCIREEA